MRSIDFPYVNTTRTAHPSLLPLLVGDPLGRAGVRWRSSGRGRARMDQLADDPGLSLPPPPTQAPPLAWRVVTRCSLRRGPMRTHAPESTTRACVLRRLVPNEVGRPREVVELSRSNGTSGTSSWDAAAPLSHCTTLLSLALSLQSPSLLQLVPCTSPGSPSGWGGRGETAVGDALRPRDCCCRRATVRARAERTAG